MTLMGFYPVVKLSPLAGYRQTLTGCRGHGQEAGRNNMQSSLGYQYCVLGEDCRLELVDMKCGAKEVDDPSSTYIVSS